MKPKWWNNKILGGLNITRATIRATMGRSSRDFMDTRLNSLNSNLSQHWSIPLPMLSPMGGWTLNIMSIQSIGWSSRAVYLCFCLIEQYLISWFYTCKVRLVHGTLLAWFLSWKKHELNKVWIPFSLFFTPIYYTVVVNSQKRWKINSPSA